MTSLSSALRSFAERMSALDSPGAPTAAHVTIDDETFALTASAVAALRGFLSGYRDPRDQGDCESCGGRRIDANFICRDCGHANGVFGQLLRERLRFTHEPAPLAAHVDDI